MVSALDCDPPVGSGRAKAAVPGKRQIVVRKRGLILSKSVVKTGVDTPAISYNALGVKCRMAVATR